MKRTLRIFGFPVISYETEDDNTVTVVQNTDGSFELFVPDEEEYDYEEDDEAATGFGSIPPRGMS